jgi:hypothetical protein
MRSTLVDQLNNAKAIWNTSRLLKRNNVPLLKIVCAMKHECELRTKKPCVFL